MHNTRTTWLTAAARPWFSLTRHDDPEPTDPKDPADPEPKDPSDDPEPTDPKDPADPDDQLGDAGKRALQKERAEKTAAKKELAAAKKALADAQKTVQDYQDRDKSDLDKATSRADAATQRAEAATARAVKAEVKAAASEFADPDDAVAFLNLATYADDSGEIDTEAIASDLADLLERKPHLKKQATAPEPKPGPKPDPSQGPRKDPPPTDWRTADRTAVDAELAKYGVKLRR
ncbi:hypothetical protein [Streptomyces sp. T028]|uniref:hypothetical protein n=1 Tax=Streptomyces sp. T028 TaxID=3394379 RepID=UPI003A8C7396